MRKTFGFIGSIFIFSLLFGNVACASREQKDLRLVSVHAEKDVTISTLSAGVLLGVLKPESISLDGYDSYEENSIFFTRDEDLKKEDVEAIYDYLNIEVPTLKETATVLSGTGLRTYNVPDLIEGKTTVDLSSVKDEEGRAAAALIADMGRYEFRYVTQIKGNGSVEGTPFTVMVSREPRVSFIVL